MRCVCANSAHLDRIRKIEEKYGGVLDMLLVTPQYLSRASNVLPLKLKTVRGREKELAKEHRVVANRSIIAFRIDEEYEELKQLLDLIIKKVYCKACT